MLQNAAEIIIYVPYKVRRSDTNFMQNHLFNEGTARCSELIKTMYLTSASFHHGRN
jgi:hypothetical protein